MHMHAHSSRHNTHFQFNKSLPLFLSKFTHLQKAMKKFQTLMSLNEEIYPLYCTGYLILQTLYLTAATCFIVGIKFSILPPNLNPIHPHV